MSYIGRGTDAISNVEKLDNITFSGTTTYALTKSSAAFTPVGANNILISIDGVIQQGNFSVSTTNIVFDFSPTSSNTCDFILHYGVGVLNTPADDSVSTAKIADGAVTAAKIADGTVVAAEIADNAITTAKILDDNVTAAKMADNSIDSDMYVDGSIDTAHIADDQVTLAKMAGLARGKIIYGDASGNPAALTVGSNGQVLKSDGTDVSWGTDSGGAALTGSTDNTVVTVTGANAIQGEANLLFDGTQLQINNASAETTTLLFNNTAGGGAVSGSGIQWDLVNTNTNNPKAKILAQEDAGDGYAEIAFQTSPSSNSSTLENRMIIRSSGKVGIGEDDPLGNLHVKTADSGASVSSLAPDLVVEGSNDAGMSILSGTAGLGSVLFADSGDNDIGQISYYHGDNSLRFVVNAGERMRIDTNGKVGIGETSPLGNLHIKTSDTGASVNAVADELVIERDGDNGMTFLTRTTGESFINFGDSGDNDIGQIKYHHAYDRMAFVTGATERMRILNNGRVQIGTDASNKFRFDENNTAHINYNNSNNGVVSCYVNGQSNATVMALKHADASGGTVIAFTDGQSQACGNISVNGSANTTAYNTSSDYRLKENETAITDGIDRIKQLKPYRFNFKADPDTTVDGFFAHEVSGIVSEAINGTKDETETLNNCVLNSDGTVYANDVSEEDWTNGKIQDEKGNQKFADDTTWVAEKTDVPKYQGIDQAKLVPLLTSALQEAITKIETLEAKVTALENA